MYVLINWSRAWPRSVYLRIQEIKSILNVLYHVCDWRLSHLRRLILVKYASSQWRGKKFLIEHVVNIKTLNGSEHDGRSFKRWYGFYAFTGGREHLIFFIEIENFRGEGKILMRHTHDTTFSEKILDFYKILEESEEFFI